MKVKLLSLKCQEGEKARDDIFKWIVLSHQQRFEKQTFAIFCIYFYYSFFLLFLFLIIMVSFHSNNIKHKIWI